MPVIWITVYQVDQFSVFCIRDMVVLVILSQLAAETMQCEKNEQPVNRKPTPEVTTLPN